MISLKNTWLEKGYGAFATVWRTLQGLDAVEMIRKERVRWAVKGGASGQAAFVAELLAA
jgi:hypothetical protein